MAWKKDSFNKINEIVFQMKDKFFESSCQHIFLFKLAGFYSIVGLYHYGILSLVKLLWDNIAHYDGGGLKITFDIEDEVVACNFFLLFFSTNTSKNRLSLYTSLWFIEMTMKRHSNGLISINRKVTKKCKYSHAYKCMFLKQGFNFLIEIMIKVTMPYFLVCNGNSKIDRREVELQLIGQ